MFAASFADLLLAPNSCKIFLLVIQYLSNGESCVTGETQRSFRCMNSCMSMFGTEYIYMSDNYPVN
jgi:hypothetical protein